MSATLVPLLTHKTVQLVSFHFSCEWHAPFLLGSLEEDVAVAVVQLAEIRRGHGDGLQVFNAPRFQANLLACTLEHWIHRHVLLLLLLFARSRYYRTHTHRYTDHALAYIACTCCTHSTTRGVARRRRPLRLLTSLLIALCDSKTNCSVNPPDSPSPHTLSTQSNTKVSHPCFRQ